MSAFFHNIFISIYMCVRAIYTRVHEIGCKDIKFILYLQTLLYKMGYFCQFVAYFRQFVAYIQKKR